MNKFTNLKKWLTVPEAAKHLSHFFGENINEADVLQLALDGNLTLSINIVNPTYVRRTKVVSWKDTEWVMFPRLMNKNPVPPEMTSGNAKCPPMLQVLWNEIPENEHAYFMPLLLSRNIDGKGFRYQDKQITQISGIYDLPMIGSERLDIEHQYHLLTGGPVVDLEGLRTGGIYVEDENGVICCLEVHRNDDHNLSTKPLTESKVQLRILEEQISNKKIKRSEAQRLLSEHRNRYSDEYLQEMEKELNKPAFAENQSDDYYPATSLPEDCVLVVRNTALRDFEQSINDTANAVDKALTTTERNTLLTIIAALCNVSKIKYQERGAASLIENMTIDIGAPVTDDTIRKVLAKIPDALASRQK